LKMHYFKIVFLINTNYLIIHPLFKLILLTLARNGSSFEIF